MKKQKTHRYSVYMLAVAALFLLAAAMIGTGQAQAEEAAPHVVVSYVDTPQHAAAQAAKRATAEWIAVHIHAMLAAEPYAAVQGG